MKKLLAAALAAGALAPLAVGVHAGTSQALCQVGVYIVKQPGVGTGNPVYVETGEYRPYTDCV